jgi:hypothetical protein
MPEEAGMELVAVPFVPTHAEYIFLSGRTILADQMEFLLAHFPRNSPLHQRMDGYAVNTTIKPSPPNKSSGAGFG